MKIITPRRKESTTQYYLDFKHSDADEPSFSFPCDANGELLPGQEECLLENYEKCKHGYPDILPLGVQMFTNSWIEPAVGLCNCGREVKLNDDYCGACKCECGQWYNIMGQALLPPDQWEEPIEFDY